MLKVIKEGEVKIAPLGQDPAVQIAGQAGEFDEGVRSLAKIQFMNKAHVKFLRAKDAAYMQAKEGARLVSNLTKESAGSAE